jgi:hypothetical protein
VLKRKLRFEEIEKEIQGTLECSGLHTFKQKMTIKNKKCDTKLVYPEVDWETTFSHNRHLVIPSRTTYKTLHRSNTTHKDQFMAKYQEFMATKHASMDDFVSISSKVNNILKWMDWILQGNLPFEFLSWDCTKRTPSLSLSPLNA